jgi:hypothetical protein
MEADGGGAFAEWLSVTTEFASLLGDDIKFKKLDEMKRIRDVDLMLFDPIARQALRTYAQLTAEVLAEDIRSKTAGAATSGEERTEGVEGAGGLYVLHSGQKFVEFTAGRCSVSSGKEEEIELAGGVTVAEYDAVIQSDAVHKRPLRTYRCQRALIRVEQEELSQTLTLELRSPTWQTTGGREETAYTWIRIRGLVLPSSVEAVTRRFRRETGLRARALAWQSANLQIEPSQKLTRLQKRLEREIRKTLADIEAETHSRLVFGIGCISMIAIGIGLGIVFKGGHLLSAFGASCIPAAVLIVCIMMGRNIATNLGSQAVSGTLLMWSGLVFLTLMAVVLYHRLLRN